MWNDFSKAVISRSARSGRKSGSSDRAKIEKAFRNLYLKNSGALPMEESFRLSYYTIEHGTKPALLSQLGIQPSMPAAITSSLSSVKI